MAPSFATSNSVQINKIDKNDERYNILSQIPKINTVHNVDYWLELPIANTERQYVIQYLCNNRKSYFYSTLLDYDVKPEDYDESDPDEPYTEVLYSFTIPRSIPISRLP
jgi:hypothetical protein